MDAFDPVEAIEAAMAHEGRSRSDLAKVIGQSRATEILKRERALTLPMIRKIAAAWHVPERVLVREYPLATSAKPRRVPNRTTRASKKESHAMMATRHKNAG